MCNVRQLVIWCSRGTAHAAAQLGLTAVSQWLMKWTKLNPAEVSNTCSSLYCLFAILVCIVCIDMYRFMKKYIH